MKSRDDPEPIYFERADEDRFRLCPEIKCSWAKHELFGSDTIRTRTEPWLTALFQSEHLSLLCGSGLSHSVHQITRGSNFAVMSKVDLSVFNKQVSDAADITAKRACREESNIEDQIRAATELLIGLGHYCPPTATFYGSGKLKRKIAELREEISRVLAHFSAAILAGERNIALAPEEKREEAFGYLISFLMSFASRTGTRDRLHIFTTNYDRIIEMGAELAGLHLLDRFLGSLCPIFHSSRLNLDMHYNPPGIRGEPRYVEGVVHFAKLHGSVDWLQTNRYVRRFGLPFGANLVRPYLQAPGLSNKTAGSLMIYPNAAKERETSEYPYVELFRDFAAAICRPNNTLVTYGYSFGDEHINRAIEDMLTIPSTHLVVISFNDPMGRIMRTYNKIGRAAQITLLIGGFLGHLEYLVDHCLPKPAIDRTTIKMAEILKIRLGLEQEKNGGADQAEGDTTLEGEK